MTYHISSTTAYVVWGKEHFGISQLQENNFPVRCVFIVSVFLFLASRLTLRHIQ
jgi:hypothetical protein